MTCSSPPCSSAHSSSKERWSGASSASFPFLASSSASSSCSPAPSPSHPFARSCLLSLSSSSSAITKFIASSVQRTRGIHHRLSLSLFFFFFYCVFFILLLSISCTYSSPIPDALKKRVYSSLDSSFHCVKYLHSEGAIGCETPFEGASGLLWPLKDEGELQSLLQNAQKAGEETPIALLITPALFTQRVLTLLRDAPGLRVAGVMVEQNDDMRTYSSSPARADLQSLLSPSSSSSSSSSSAIPPDVPLISTVLFNRSFVWNPFGDNLRDEYFPFDLQLLSEQDTTYVRQCAEANVLSASSDSSSSSSSSSPTFLSSWFSSTSAFHAEFRNPSYARSDSFTCLEEEYCNPVGSFSVWHSMRPLNASEEFVMAIASLDSQSMFTASSIGADADQSGVIVLLAAAHALGVSPMAALDRGNSSSPSSNSSAYPPPSSLPQAALVNLTRNIVFFFPHAETYSHTGSRKFVNDLLYFECQELSPSSPSSSSSTSSNTSDQTQIYSQQNCDLPLKFDLTFQALSRNRTGDRVALSKIAGIIELQQVGLNSTLFVHTERDANKARDAFAAALYRAAAGANSSSPSESVAAASNAVRLEPASLLTPGIPPSASQTFLSVNYSLPVLVVSDHAQEFTNRFYHSHLDDGESNLLHPEADPSSPSSPSLCSLATIVARALYIQAGGLENASLSIVADCKLVTRLVRCFTLDVTCAELGDFNGHLSGGGTPSHAPGLFFPSPPENFVYPSKFERGYSSSSAIYVSFIADALERYFVNSSGISHLHEAIDPAWDAFDLDAQEWKLLPGLERAPNDTRLWTQANPVPFGTLDHLSTRFSRLFRSESPLATLAMALIALALTSASIAFSWMLTYRATHKFKVV